MYWISKLLDTVYNTCTIEFSNYKSIIRLDCNWLKLWRLYRFAIFFLQTNFKLEEKEQSQRGSLSYFGSPPKLVSSDF